MVDERTLRELYLPAFETVVTESAPWTVMCSYNLVNGELRLGVTGGCSPTSCATSGGSTAWSVATGAPSPTGVRASHAGLDLEMPSSSGAWNARVVAALESGALAEADLDLACERVVELVLRVEAGIAAHGGAGVADHDAHHVLARRAAAAGTVLLSNDGILPLAPRGRIALIGAFAEHPRFQGAGSSLVQPDPARHRRSRRCGPAG